MEQVSLFRPKVSIIIPVYNGSNYLREAIDSALAQSYSNIEVIVINDGSNDGGKTQAIINSYGSRIRSYYKENGGVASALNLGIDEMSGEYFSWLSHDDKYLPNKVESQIRKIEETGNKYAIIYSGYEIINEQGMKVGEFRPERQYPIYYYQHPLFPVLRLLINGCTLLFHRDHFLRVGGFNIQLKTTQDYDMWYKLFKDQVVIYDNQIAVINRSHRKQTSRTDVSYHVKECDELWIRMLGSLSEKDLSSIDDNAYAFFKKTHDFLKSRTLYAATIDYTRIQALCHLRRLLLNGQKYESIVTASTEMFENDMLLHNAFNDPAIMGKQKPRVAFFATEKAGKGGLMKVFNLVAKELSKYYEVVIFYSNERTMTYEREGNIIRIKLGTRGNWQEQMCKSLVVLGVDVFVGSHNCLMHFIDLYRRIKSYGVKCIAWNHEDYFFTRINSAYHVVGERRKPIFHSIDAVIWINKSSKVLYDMEARNGVYIPNCIEANYQVGAQTKEPYSIIAVGRYQDQVKRLDRLLAVFAKVCSRRPEASLYIIGDNCMDMKLENLGYMTVREKMQQLGIQPNKVIFTGWLPQPTNYYSHGVVQVCTSDSEGFGLVIPEAAVYGVPAVAFSNGGADTIIENGQNGYIVSSEEEMADKVCTIFENKELYDHLYKQSKVMSENYKVEIVIEKWKQLLKAVINSDGQIMKPLVDDPEINKSREAINAFILNRKKQLALKNK